MRPPAEDSVTVTVWLCALSNSPTLWPSWVSAFMLPPSFRFARLLPSVVVGATQGSRRRLGAGRSGGCRAGCVVLRAAALLLGCAGVDLQVRQRYFDARDIEALLQSAQVL